MMKKGILLTLCILVAGTAQADEDWLVRRLKACEKGSTDWACRHFEESMSKKASENEKVETVTQKTEKKTQTVKKNDAKSVKSTGIAPVKPKVKAKMKKPVDVAEVSAGDTIVEEFEEIAEKDWIIRRVNACEENEDDWACRHYKRALQEAKEEKARVYKEQLEEERRQKLLAQQEKEMAERRKAEEEALAKAKAEKQRLEEEQRRLAALVELDKQREKARLEELERQKKAAQEAERQRIQRENELRKKAEEIIKRRVEETKTYKTFSSGEERQQEDRILAEYYRLKLNHKSEGLEEKINWLEQSKNNL
jgi:hypothetical protein